MTIEEIYKLAIKMGIDADPRGRKEVEKVLKKTKEAYEKLEKDEKEEFDKEQFENPYADSRILVGEPKTQIKTIMCGIDIGGSSILLADGLNKEGKSIDLIVTHHPEGGALAALHKVVGLQADLLHKFGVPINIAEGFLEKRIAQVQRCFNPINHNLVVDTAKLLNIPLVCTHTVTDNLVYNFLQKELDKVKPETLADTLKFLKTIPEYKEAVKINAGPTIFIGTPERRAGKIACVEITGGTNGAKELYEKMANAGIGTIISMHMAEDYKEEAEKYNINVVVAGHISSDSLGMNLFLDELEKKGIKMIPMGGLIRISRISTRGGSSSGRKKKK